MIILYTVCCLHRWQQEGNGDETCMKKIPNDSNICVRHFPSPRYRLSVLNAHRTLVQIGGEEKAITDRARHRARPLNQHLVICPPPHKHTAHVVLLETMRPAARRAGGKQDFGAVWCFPRCLFGILHISQTSVYTFFRLISELFFCVLGLISFQPLFNNRPLGFPPTSHLSSQPRISRTSFTYKQHLLYHEIRGTANASHSSLIHRLFLQALDGQT